MKYEEKEWDLNEKTIIEISFSKNFIKIIWGIWFLGVFLLLLLFLLNKIDDITMEDIFYLVVWLVLWTLWPISVMSKILNSELVLTNKRVMGAVPVFIFLGLKIMDAPLKKIQTITIIKGWLWDTINIATAAGKYTFRYVQDVEIFRKKLMEAIAKVEEEQLRKQAEQLAATV